MNKYFSRKFIACLTGILTGVGVIASGNKAEGIVAVIVSVLGYIIAEGYIDAKAVNNIIQIADSTLEGVSDALEKEKGQNNDKLL